MGKCVISLTFDDGRQDNYQNAFSILKKYFLPCTFYVVTGYIDGSIKYKEPGNSNCACSKKQLYEMKNLGCEISSHSDNHSIDVDSIKKSIYKLKKWKLSNYVGFSIPHSDEKIYKNNDFKWLIDKNQLSYVRTGKNNEKLTFLKKIYYLMYKITKSSKYYCLYNKININYISNLNRYKLVSIPIKLDDKLETIIKFINKYKNDNVIIIFMFHSIIENNKCYDKWEWEVEKFDGLCKYLYELKMNKEIIVDTVIKAVGDKK